MPSGIRIPKENIGDAVACLTPRVPAFEDRGHVFRGPRDVQRTPIHKYQDNGLACGNDSLEQFLLSARQLEGRSRSGFTAHQRDLAKHEYCYIASFCKL